MNKEEILNTLLKGLKKKSDEEVIKEYPAASVTITDYNKSTVGNVKLYLMDNNSLKIDKILKESCIENEVKNYLDTQNIPINLRNNVKFIELTIQKFYLENDINNLKEDIESDYFDGASPDEINEFYSQSKQKMDEEIREYNKKIEEKEEKYIKAVKELSNVEKKINNMNILKSIFPFE